MGRLSLLLFPSNSSDDRDAPLATSAGFSILGTVAQGVVRFGSSVLIARLAGKEVLGQFNLMLALAVFLVLCWPQACGTAATKFVAMARGQRDVQQLAAVARFAARAALIGAIPLAVVGGVYAALALDASTGTALWVGCLVVSLSVYNLVRGLRAGQNQFSTSAAWDLVGGAMSLALMTVVLLADAPSLLLLPLIIGYVVSAASGWPRLRATLDTDHRKEIVKYVAWGTVYATAAGGLLQLTILIAGVHSTKHELGDLAAAVALATPIGLLSIVVRASAAPSVSRMYAAGDFDGVRRRVDLVTRILVLLLTPIIGTAIIASPWLMQFAFGPEFRSGSTVLVLLLVGVTFSSFDPAHMRLSSTYARGIQHSALYNLVGLFAGALAALLLGPRLGEVAAGVGFAIGTAVTSMIVTAIVWRLDAMDWTGLALRLCAGYLAIFGCLAFVREADHLGLAVLASVVFAVLWALMSLPDLKRIRHVR